MARLFCPFYREHSLMAGSACLFWVDDNVPPEQAARLHIAHIRKVHLSTRKLMKATERPSVRIA